VLGAAALGFLIACVVIHDDAVAIALAVLAAALLMCAVLMPAITRIEFGFPSLLKVTADIRNRQEALRQAFEAQRTEFEDCAKLLCDDPDTASDLLARALTRAAANWRGPVHAAIRAYVLCWLVNQVLARGRYSWMQQPSPRTGDALSQLTQVQRIVVVLNESGEVPVEQIADMVGVSLAEAQAELSNAKQILANASGSGGGR
jgi:DNA-directed RNA polymerase specialized sigma24 family protein